ncbi:MAG TPA: CDP-glycerol glycerophosphotransferase family protein [Mycobacteriales bacterium]|nr:CDP-glycerol glycerophosphotransferase family protein [Mycobacteriales bacterium]
MTPSTDRPATRPGSAAAAPKPAASQQLTSAVADRAEDSVGRPSARGEHSWSAYLGLGCIAVYAALGVTGILSVSTPFLALLLASQVLDVLIVSDDNVRAVLARGQFGIATRSVVRELAAAVLVLTDDWAGHGTRVAAALCVLGLAGLRLLYQLLLVPVRRRAAVPIETRNIDLGGLRLPPVPHPLLVTRLSERTHAVTLVGLLGAAIGVVANVPAVVFAIVGLVLLVELAGVGIAGWLLLIGSRALSREELLDVVQARVAALRPEVMLYHSGDPEATYQANMWLSTMEQLPRSCVIVLRERLSMQLLAPTTVPVLCIPQPVDFMTFPMRDVRVALYTANVGKTIHMLREPGVHHVFIGHGDSDKTASSNPFSKVYTEIWVAGAAGRDRYRRANVGIHDDDIFEVGRPQLAGIQTFTGIPDGALTVLYAPTWEGWTNDPAHTSVTRTGPALVERLVARPDVRVLYKPHPLTGSVSPAAARSDERIRATIARAGAPHQVVVGSEPSLYDCFNLADMLVGDISSVLSDFIASQKPYVVTNLTALPDGDFRAAFPSASAAYLLDPDATSIGAILDQVRSGDPLAGDRHELKFYLLGPDEPDALTRFIAAVDAAYDRAVALCPERPLLSAAGA